MRYHTRAKDVITAITILLAITALIGWTLVFDSLPSPAKIFSDYLLGLLDDPSGSSSLSFTSIERNLFSKLTIHDLSYIQGGELSVQADEVYLEGGLLGLLVSLFSSKPIMQLVINEPQVAFYGNLSQSDAKMSVPRFIQSWVKRLRLEAFSTEGSYEASQNNVDVTVDEVDFALFWNLNQELPNLTVNAQSLMATNAHMGVDTSVVLINLQQDGLFTFSSSNTTVTSDEVHADIGHLFIRGEIEHLANQAFTLQATLDQSTIQQRDLFIQSPLLSLSAAYAKDQPLSGSVYTSFLEVITDTLRLQGRDIDLHIPQLYTLFLSASGLDVEGSGVRATLQDITLSVEERKAPLYRVNLTLGEAMGEYEDIGVNARSLDAVIQGSFEEGRIGNVEVQSSAIIDLQYDSLFSFPIEAAFRYDAQTDQIVGRAFSNALTSELLTEELTFQFAYRRDEHRRELDGFIEQRSALRLQFHAEDHQDDEFSLQLTGRFNHFTFGVIEPLLTQYAPFLTPYYEFDTALTGNLVFTGQTGRGTLFPFDGRISLDGSLSNIQVGRFTTSAGFLLSTEVQNDLIEVSSAALSAEGLRLSYQGKTHLKNSMTDGVITLNQITDNRLLGRISVSSAEDQLFTLDFITPLVPSLGVTADVGLADYRLLYGSGVIDLFDISYPFEVHFNLSTLEFNIEQEDRLSILGSFIPNPVVTFDANYFRLPVNHIAISGSVLFTFHTFNAFTIESEQISLHNLRVGANVYSVDAQLFLSSDELIIQNARFTDWIHTYSGSAHYQGAPLLSLMGNRFIQPYAFDLSIYRATDAIIQLALLSSDDRLSSLFVTNGLSLGAFFPALEGTYADVNLLFSSDLADMITLSGTLNVQSELFSLSTKVGSSGHDLRLYDSFVRSGELTFTGDLLTIDNEQATLLGYIEHIRHLSYIDQLSHIDVEASLSLPRVTNLFALPAAIQTLRKGIGRGSISLGEPLLLGGGGFSGGVHYFESDGATLTVEGTFLNGSYGYESRFLQARVDPSFGLGATITADFNRSRFGIKVEDLYLPLPVLNRTFLKPVFSFHEGVARGTLFVTDSLSDPKIYGQLTVDSAQMETFWVADDIISLKNLTVSIDGSRAISPTLPFFSTNQKTGQVVTGNALLSAQLDGFGLDHYEINVTTSDGRIFLWIPLLGFDADAKMWAEGTFNLWGRGLQTWLSGDLTISDATLSLGVRGLPYWYTYENLTSTDFTLTTAKGVSFLYPNIANPVIKATISEGETLKFTYNHLNEEITMGGNLALRSGEIYYFQKDFFITEGSLSLHTDTFGGATSVQPTINLRAKLTDYDQSGKRVDIFLILREASFTALNPQFESLPAKDTNEIFEILGQSILPSGAYGQFNWYSAASLAAAATNVAERLGYIDVFQTSALTESIRLSLGLDMFSLRSNILQNILLDALPGSTLGTTFSPLARYLHNTVIFMGKYVGMELFLQALIHLTATDQLKIRNSFLAPDLALNVELSLEWSNPLLTFSLFTQPNELSFIDILDTIGLSVTKRIVFR